MSRKDGPHSQAGWFLSYLGQPADTPLQAVAADGSQRRFYRAGAPGRMILMHNPLPNGPRNGVDENSTFLYVQRLLQANGLPVPEVYGHSPDMRWIALQDLGGASLHAYWLQTGDPAPLFSVTALIYRMGRLKGFRPRHVFNAPYSAEFAWQQEALYGLRYFISPFARSPLRSLTDELKDMALRLGAFRYPGFMHRDCQSRNILLVKQSPHFIDFQGARMGSRAYDLASFLFDPYLNIPPTLRKQLYGYFVSRMEAAGENVRYFADEFLWCAFHRLLQALGAYGKLALCCGKPFFKPYMATGLRILLHLLRHAYFCAMTGCKEVVAHIYDAYKRNPRLFDGYPGE